MKASIHFTDVEWKEFKVRLEAERKKTGYKISVNKFLRKALLHHVIPTMPVKEATEGRR